MVIAGCATLALSNISVPEDCSSIQNMDTCLRSYSKGCRIHTLTENNECFFDKDNNSQLMTFFCYAVGFVIVQHQWTLHHGLFQTRYKGMSMRTYVLILNGFFAMALSLLPFSFGLLAEFVVFGFKGEVCIGGSCCSSRQILVDCLAIYLLYPYICSYLDVYAFYYFYLLNR